MLPEGPGGRRARGRGVHRRPHHPGHRPRASRISPAAATTGVAAARSASIADGGGDQAESRPGPARRSGRRSASAWWAAGWARLSARCIGWRRGSTTSSSSWPARCRARRSSARPRARPSASTPARTYASYRRNGRAASAAARTASTPSPIVTPNHLHACRRTAFLEAGFHVICDKPLTTTLEEARAAGPAGRADRGESSCSRTITPAIRWRGRRAAWSPPGRSGRCALVQVEYPQDWLALPSSGRAHSRPSGAWTRRAPAPAAAPATSAPTPSTSPPSSAGSSWRSWRPS